MVLRIFYDHLYITLSDNHSPLHCGSQNVCLPHTGISCLSVPQFVLRAFGVQYTPIIYGPRPQGVVILSHSNSAPNVTILFAMPLAHVHSTIPSWSGCKLLRATYFTNRTRGNICRNLSYNDIGLQPQCPKKAGSDSSRVASETDF
jgi:hypothetical protein